MAIQCRCFVMSLYMYYLFKSDLVSMIHLLNLLLPIYSGVPNCVAVLASWSPVVYVLSPFPSCSVLSIVCSYLSICRLFLNVFLLLMCMICIVFPSSFPLCVLLTRMNWVFLLVKYMRKICSESIDHHRECNINFLR